jgi:hypothetical protein
MKMKITKYDFFLLGALLILTFLFAFLSYFSSLKTQNQTITIVQISVDGQTVAKLPLEQDTEYLIETKYGKNLLLLENGSASLQDSDCPNRTCEGMGKISQVGESIICLPHRLIITLVTENEL